MANYMEWKMVGVQKRIKKDVVPHIFDCQEDRKRTFTHSECPSAALKRKKLQIITESLQQPSTSAESHCIASEKVIDIDVTPSATDYEEKYKSIAVQVNLRIRPTFRSKAIQCALLH